MKKILFIAIAAILTTVSCSKTIEVIMPILSVSVVPVQVKVGETATYTVKINPIQEEDVTVRIKVDNPDLLTVPANVIIVKGQRTATFEGTAKAPGLAKTTIFAPEGMTTGVGNATIKINPAQE